MKIIEELKYQYNKKKDCFEFKKKWIRKWSSCKKKVSKTILVIRIDAIGDCIIWLDQAKEYRNAFPNHKIVLLHNKTWSEIAEQLPWFDEWIPFNREKIGDIEYYHSLLSSLNKYTYEKLFSPVFSRDFITVDWIVHNVNAKEKIGYEGDYQNNYGVFGDNPYYLRNSNRLDLKSIADSWYSTLIPNDPNCDMELQRNAHFIRQTINTNFRSKLPTIPFGIPTCKDIPSTEYAVLFLGASNEKKMWSINNFVQIVQHIPYNSIVLCGAKQEQHLAESFKSKYKGNKTIIDLTGKTSLLTLISVISNAKIVVSNDTSASHIAVSTRTRSICILGGGHYGRFHPYQADDITNDDNEILPHIVTTNDKACFNCDFRCKYPLQNGRWRCIDNIQAGDVIDVIKKIKH